MTVFVDMQQNPNANVCAFFFLHILNVNLLFVSLYFQGGKTLTAEDYKSLLATHISVRMEMTSSF